MPIGGANGPGKLQVILNGVDICTIISQLQQEIAWLKERVAALEPYSKSSEQAPVAVTTPLIASSAKPQTERSDSETVSTAAITSPTTFSSAKAQTEKTPPVISSAKAQTEKTDNKAYPLSSFGTVTTQPVSLSKSQVEKSDDKAQPVSTEAKSEVSDSKTRADTISTNESRDAQNPQNVPWEAFVSKLYAEVCKDPQINRFFAGTKLGSLKRNQSCFFKRIWEKENPPLPEDIHKVWMITEADFEIFMRYVQHSMLEYSTAAVTEAFCQRLRVYMPGIVKAPDPVPPTAPKVYDLDTMQRHGVETIAASVQMIFEEVYKLSKLPPPACLLGISKYLHTCLTQSWPDGMDKASYLQTLKLASVHKSTYISAASFAFVREMMNADRILMHPEIQKAWKATEIEVTCNADARLKAAAKNKSKSSNLKDSVYMWNVLNDWYSSMKSDEVLKQFFGRSTGSADTVAKSQFKFILSSFMNSNGIDRDSTANRLRSIHSQLMITDSHFDRFLQKLSDRMRGDPGSRDALLEFIESFRPLVVRRALVNSNQNSAGCPVTGNLPESGQSASGCPFGRSW